MTLDYARAQLGKGDAPEKPKTKETHYPREYIVPQWWRFHEHGLLPDPGGYDDQDAAKMDDFALLSAWFNYHMHMLVNGKKTRGRERKVARFDEVFSKQDAG